MAEEKHMTITEAVVKVQRSVVVPKARFNPHGKFNYRSMEDIVAALKEPCKEVGVAYTLKMSYTTDHAIEGFFEYVVPPLEGFWWQEGVEGFDCTRKSSLSWVSAIRVPEFVGEGDFAWALDAATAKKGLDFSPVRLVRIDEGLCVQCMHVGPYDGEPATVAAMHAFAEGQGYAPDFSDARRHHEIYLSDPRKADPAKMKTVVRHPIRRA